MSNVSKMSENTKKRLDPYEMVQERLEEFEKKVAKIEEKMSEIEDKTRKSYDKYTEYIKSLSVVVSSDIVIMDWCADLNRRASGDTSLFDVAIERIKEKRRAMKRIEELGLTAYTITVQCQTREIIRIARNWAMPFENIASYLIRALGKEEVRKLVQKEVLMAFYGKEIIPIWESLLKE